MELADVPVPILCLEGRQGISLERIKKGLFEQAIAVDWSVPTPAPLLGVLADRNIFHPFDSQIDRLINAIGQLV